MVQLIVGDKGKGKTKYLLDKVNSEIQNTNGNIVYLDKKDALLPPVGSPYYHRRHDYLQEGTLPLPQTVRSASSKLRNCQVPSYLPKYLASAIQDTNH